MEINKVGEIDSKIDSTTEGKVRIEIINTPTLRYMRRVTFTKLDLMGEFNGNFSKSLENLLMFLGIFIN